MKTVLITGARAPIALDLAHSFHAAGYQPHLADCIRPWTAHWSRFGRSQLHRFAPPRTQFSAFTADIARFVDRLDPVLIIPACEEVFYLAEAAATLQLHDRVFAPPLTLLRQLHSKIAFASLVQSCGLTGPATRRVTSRAALQEWVPHAASLVFKPEFSRFATNTLVRPTPGALAKINPTSKTAWAVQDFIEGTEICLWSAARHGQIVAFAAYQPRWRLGHSSSFYFEPDHDPKLLEFCKIIAQRTNVTGQLAFDIIRDPTGTIHPLECNPRGVSGIHLFAATPSLARALTGEAELALAPIMPRHLAPAMWLLGAPRALGRGQWPRFRSDLRRSSNALTFTGDHWSNVAAILDAMRFLTIGLRNGRTAAGQSTDDIEWNGEPIA
jgi:hypothetical protein